jgi:hypothetical protein
MATFPNWRTEGSFYANREPNLAANLGASAAFTFCGNYRLTKARKAVRIQLFGLNGLPVGCLRFIDLFFQAVYSGKCVITETSMIPDW